VLKKVLFWRKKTEIKAKKGQTKKVNLGWHRDRKHNPINTPSIHIDALMGVSSLWARMIRSNL